MGLDDHVTRTLYVQDQSRTPLADRIQHAFWDLEHALNPDPKWGFVSPEDIARQVAHAKELLEVHLAKVRKLSVAA